MTIRSLLSAGTALLTLASVAGAIPPIQLPKLTASDGAAFNQFGYSVALSNTAGLTGAQPDLCLVGIPYDIYSGVGKGSVNIYKMGSNGAWAFEGKFVATDGLLSDFFGASVALFGDTALVGAPGDDIGANTDQGSAYIFKRASNGAWTQTAKIVAADPGAGDQFGWSVALSNTTVATTNSADLAVVGSLGDDVGAVVNQGSAYVFKKATAGTWAQEGKLVAVDGADSDLFGNAVSLYGDRAVVGSYGDDIGAVTNRGAAYIYKRGTTGTWTQEGKLIASDGANDDYFGYSVCIFNNQILVGAPNDDFAAVLDRGSAYVFQLSGTSTWTQEAKLVASDGVASDFFGSSIGLQGNLAVVASPNDDGVAQGGTTNYTNLGAAYVFTQSGTSTWTQQARFTCLDGQNEKYFGDSAAIYGQWGLFGTPGDDIGTPVRQDQGCGYLFDLLPVDCNGNGIPDAEDIASGISHDCNTNAIPDSCDITAGTSQDVDSDGVPDECRADCNNNDIPDAWEISQGLVPDCNTNQVPDSCDIAGASDDVDNNGVPDECQTDCNNNDLPDSWEIAQGLVRDCNANQVPDSCDIAGGSADTDADGRLDSCEQAFGDFNLDGAIDGLDLTFILTSWGATNPPMGDLDHDGVIAGGDLTAIFARWGLVP